MASSKRPRCEAKGDEKECCACMNAPARMLQLECGHRDMCATCAFKVFAKESRCPTCRTSMLLPLVEEAPGDSFIVADSKRSLDRARAFLMFPDKETGESVLQALKGLCVMISAECLSAWFGVVQMATPRFEDVSAEGILAELKLKHPNHAALQAFEPERADVEPEDDVSDDISEDASDEAPDERAEMEEAFMLSSRRMVIDAMRLCNNDATLTELEFNESALGDDGASNLALALRQNTVLTSLDVRSTGICRDGGIAIMNALSVNKTLVSLSIGNNNLHAACKDPAVLSLSENTSLKSLDLTAARIDAEGAARMAEMLRRSSIETFCIRVNTIGDEGTVAIAGMLAVNSTLRTLDLDKVGMTAVGMTALGEALSKNTTLRTLHLSGNKIGDEGSAALGDALKKNTSLNRLIMYSMGFGQGLKHITLALGSSATISSIDLSNNKLGDSGFDLLVAALRANSSIESIDLTDNDIGDYGISQLVNALMQKPVKRLILDENDIHHLGVSQITRLLRPGASKLRMLSLSRNHVGEDGAAMLDEALRTNTTLEVLDLVDNHIGDAGAVSMAKTLAVNGSMTELMLDDNDINREGAVAIFKALRENGKLQRIDMPENHIGNAGAAELAAMIGVNKTLVCLNIFKAGFGVAGARAIADAVCGSATVTSCSISSMKFTKAKRAELRAAVGDRIRFV